MRFVFYAEIQDGRLKWQETDVWKNAFVGSADTLWVKNLSKSLYLDTLTREMGCCVLCRNSECQ